MLTENYKIFYDRLSGKIDKKRMFHDPLYTLAYGTDASFYRLIPKLIVKPIDEDEVSFLLKEAGKLGLSVTFRAAGTSLSGQAISDSVLVVIGDYWNNYEIMDNGGSIRLQPGLRGGKVNAFLAPYKRKIGPDPASINAAMIGGIAANNASGMCCGTAENSYKTLESMRIVLKDGTVLDTANNTSKNEFLISHTLLIKEISDLSSRVKGNETLTNRIRQKFKIKNTIGYSLNALIDFTDPFDIIEHLMIGSEGTLGFISEITYNTVIEHPFKASSFITFPDIENACKAVTVLKEAPVSAVELIDRAGLRSIEGEKGVPDYLSALIESACSLLVETRAQNKKDLYDQIELIKKSIGHISVVFPIEFTDVPSEYELLWNIRKGLFPSVGAMRKAGTTVIIEDVAFPFPSLANAIADLHKLLIKYHYHEAVIFGHVLEGNLHFVFTQDFGDQKEITRYKNFINELTRLVINKYDGSLKAEHGTGRNMAPFVEMEWGTEAFELIRKIKDIFDPENLLNPGVILNPDPKVHLKDLKPLPMANEIIDKCMECGFCEPSCVSSEFTLTPRQRIVVYREMSVLKENGKEPYRAASLVNNFEYTGNSTCATDGLCAVSCPVKIDTGKFIKFIREESITTGQNRKANWIADHMGFITSMARGGLSFVNISHIIFGTPIMQFISGAIRRISGNNIPKWNKYMPSGAKSIKLTNKTIGNPKKVVYFPSCINRSMGVSRDHREEIQLTRAIQKLLDRAGYEIIFPERLNDLCCGMAFSSKGYRSAGLKKSKELEEALWKASNEGSYPVLCDMSPCLYTMKENMEPTIKLFEPIEFILEYLVKDLNINIIDDTIVVFPVCSTKKMGLETKLVDLAKLCATNVLVAETNCCGFAGDRGFTYPELNKHGLRNLKNQIPEEVKQGYSTSRTCEIGLSLNSDIPFKSIIYLVEKASR